MVWLSYDSKVAASCRTCLQGALRAHCNEYAALGETPALLRRNLLHQELNTSSPIFSHDLTRRDRLSVARFRALKGPAKIIRPPRGRPSTLRVGLFDALSPTRANAQCHPQCQLCLKRGLCSIIVNVLWAYLLASHPWHAVQSGLQDLTYR